MATVHKELYVLPDVFIKIVQGNKRIIIVMNVKKYKVEEIILIKEIGSNRQITAKIINILNKTDGTALNEDLIALNIEVLE